MTLISFTEETAEHPYLRNAAWQFWPDQVLENRWAARWSRRHNERSGKISPRRESRTRSRSGVSFLADGPDAGEEKVLAA